MPLRFRCMCGQKVKTPDGTAGKRAQCPMCHRWLRIPQSDNYSTTAEEASHHDEHLQPAGVQSAASEAPAGASAASTQAPPAASAAQKPAGAPIMPPPPANAAKGLIIVADSDTPELERTVEILRLHGYAVLETLDGNQTIEMIRSHNPDAVVLDVHLNNVSGFQVIDQLKNLGNAANKNVWNVPFLVTTTRLRGRDKQYAMSLGADSYFVKPLSPAQLCARLEKVIAKYRAR